MFLSVEEACEELDRLEQVTARFESVTSVFGSEAEVLEEDVRAVVWRPGEVTVFPQNLVSTRLPLRAQLLQAAHFVFHRLTALNRYPSLFLRGVVVK